MDFTAASRFLQTIAQTGPAGCALSISRDGRPVLEQYEGLADVESGRPIGPDTVYRIYSGTKEMTVVAALILYERGVYLLDDPVSEYLPEFRYVQVAHSDGRGAAVIRPAEEVMRVHDAFRMTTGIPYPDDSSFSGRKMAEVQERLTARGGYTTAEFFHAVAEEVPLLFEPGAGWLYGMSIDLLGRLVEVWSGKTLGAFLQEELFDPLGMKDTAFFFRDDLRERLCTVSYRQDGRMIRYENPLEFRYEPAFTSERGGGGLLSTLADYSAFGQMLSMGGTRNGVRILNPRTVGLMRRNHLTPQQMEAYRRVHENRWPQLKGYGYGLGVRMVLDPAQAGALSAGEFGWSGMAGTLSIYDTEERLAVLYMQQILPGELSMESYIHPRIRNTVYAALNS